MDDWNLQPAGDLGLSGAERRRSLRREAGSGELLLQLGWWWTTRAYLKLAHGVKVTGLEHLPPDPPFVVVANHSSHLDGLVLATMLPRRMRNCVFPVVAGDTFFETPAVSMFAATFLNALPLWRRKAGRHEMGELRNRLVERACVFVLFPEGTRSRDGTMGRFKPGIGMLVAGTKVPVVPCHVEGAHDAWKPETKRPKFGAKVAVTVGRPMTFGDVGNERAGWDRIAADLESVVRALSCPFSPVLRGEG
jgi:1-acyl-sn-glycerol-3-phosphate acyltransferase